MTGIYLKDPFCGIKLGYLEIFIEEQQQMNFAQLSWTMFLNAVISRLGILKRCMRNPTMAPSNCKKIFRVGCYDRFQETLIEGPRILRAWISNPKIQPRALCSMRNLWFRTNSYCQKKFPDIQFDTLDLTSIPPVELHNKFDLVIIGNCIWYLLDELEAFLECADLMPSTSISSIVSFKQALSRRSSFSQRPSDSRLVRKEWKLENRLPMH